MPIFAPGEVKTARAPITVSPSGLDCRTELYLVSNGAKVATAGIKSFISTGARQDISFPITMPSAEGTYPVYLDVAAQGVLIAAYQAIEDVVVEALIADIRVENLVISPAEVNVGEKVTITCTAKNYGDAAGTKKIVCTVS